MITSTFSKASGKKTRTSPRPAEESLLEIYKRARPGEPHTVESARSYFRNAFFDSRRYDLSRVGRYKLNRKLGPEIDFLEQQFGLDLERPDPDQSVLAQAEMLAATTYLLNLAHATPGYRLDDQDHFANRRIRSVGELIQNQVRIGLSRMERVVRERMDYPGCGSNRSPDVDQHPTRCRSDQRVLRDLAAFAVHGSGQPAIRG